MHRGPFRSVLFVPGHREHMLAKSLAYPADALLPDLEDSVPPAEKAVARATVQTFLSQVRDHTVFVRVNSVAGGDAQSDLEAVVVPGISGVFVPKIESAQQIVQLSSWLDHLESAAGLPNGNIGVVPMIESAMGVVKCIEIATSSPRIATLCIGSAEDGDLHGDLGCEWSPESPAMLYARSRFLLEARAAGVEYPLDGVYARLDDEVGLIADTELSRRLGYSGRTLVHPKQIEHVNRIYSPSPEEVNRARRLLAAFEEAGAAGTGAIRFEGRLVDAAMAAKARSILGRASLIER
jgi:citrate lyase subunit beta/citryl-CoA lyase